MEKRRGRLRTYLCGAILAATGLAGSMSGAGADWQADLRDQMLAEHRCLIGFFSQIDEHVVEGVTIVMVRLHCQDGRVFEASRRDPFGPFRVVDCSLRSC